MLERKGRWFYQYYPDNPLISLIRFSSDSEFEVFLKSGNVKTYYVQIDAIYLSQYGIPLSEDGTRMYLSGWERGTGLNAYNTLTGELIWRMKTSKIRSVFVFHDYGVALRYADALLKFDLITGELLDSMKSTSITEMYLLINEIVLVDRFKRNLSIIDLREFRIKQRIPEKYVNPNDCLSCVIVNAEINDNELLLSGFEQHPNKQHSKDAPINYRRAIPISFTD